MTLLTLCGWAGWGGEHNSLRPNIANVRLSLADRRGAVSFAGWEASKKVILRYRCYCTLDHFSSYLLVVNDRSRTSAISRSRHDLKVMEVQHSQERLEKRRVTWSSSSLRADVVLPVHVGKRRPFEGRQMNLGASVHLHFTRRTSQGRRPRLLQCALPAGLQTRRVGPSDRRTSIEPRARNVTELCPPVKVPGPSNRIQEDERRRVGCPGYGCPGFPGT